MKLKVNTQNLKIDNWFTEYEIEVRIGLTPINYNNQLIIFLRYETEDN
jgi:hypothetical protein